MNAPGDGPNLTKILIENSAVNCQLESTLTFLFL